MGAFDFVEDRPDPNVPEDDFVRDMRFLLPVARLNIFEHWLYREFDRTLDVRLERHPIRELREELVKECQVFSDEEFDRLLGYETDKNKYSPTVVSRPQDVAELLSNNSPERRLKALERLSVEKSLEITSKIAWALIDSELNVRRRAVLEIAARIQESPAVARGLSGPLLFALAVAHRDSAELGYSSSALCQMRNHRADLRHWLRAVHLAPAVGLVALLSKTLYQLEWLAIDYEEDPALGKTLDQKVVVVVKRIEGPKDQAFPPAARYRPDLVGRDSWRPYYTGMLIAIDLKEDEISEKRAIWYRYFVEPYDLVLFPEFLAVTVGNGVLFTDKNGGDEKQIKSPWFAQIHSLDASPDGRRLLVTSSGFDALIEFAIDDGALQWTWFAFEHEFGASSSPWRVSRSQTDVEDLRRHGLRALLVEDPHKHAGFGLPTQYRSHLNDARYIDQRRIAATLAQLGHAVILDRQTERPEIVLTGLQAPHGFVPMQDGFVICDTQRGRMLQLDKRFNVRRQIYLSGLGGVTNRRIDGVEWLQGAAHLRDDLFLLIDGARDCIWLIDVASRKYRKIAHSDRWRVHRVVPVRSQNSRRFTQDAQMGS